MTDVQFLCLKVDKFQAEQAGMLELYNRCRKAQLREQQMGANFPTDDVLGVDKPREQSTPHISHGSAAIAMIEAERKRQVSEEDWDESHDDNHVFEELAKAAACYAFPSDIESRTEHWPWDSNWWKPTSGDRIRELVKAGALIVAEIERLQRQQD